MTLTPDNPHDKLFKRTFSVRDNAIGELRLLLPAALLARIDLSTLEVVPGEFVDEALKSSHSDLLYSVQLADRPAFIYVLFEHQSTSDPLLPLRLLRYIVRILERHAHPPKDTEYSDAKADANAHAHRLHTLPLPVVIPAVLHHSEKGWTGARRLEDLFDPELVAVPELTPLIPRLSFLLDDISQLSDEALRERALNLVTTLTLWAMRDARSAERLLGTLAGWAGAIVALLRQPDGRDVVATLFRYITLVTDRLSVDDLIQRIHEVVPEAEDAIMTIAEQLQAKGRAEGEARGRAEGQRSLLLRQLTLKFGELPEPIRTRVARASADDLDRWSERILSASALEGVFEASE